MLKKRSSFETAVFSDPRKDETLKDASHPDVAGFKD